MSRSNKKKRKNKKNYSVIIVLVACLTIGFATFKIFEDILSPILNTDKEKDIYFYIPTGASFDQIIDKLYVEQIIQNKTTFYWLAKSKNYDQNIHPGRYKIPENLSSNELINLLRSGKQEPVQLTFNNIRTKEQFVSKVTKHIEADSINLIKLLNDSIYLNEFGFNKYNIIALFIPNTYEFFWNTSAEAFIKRMYREYNIFWNKERKEKAKNMGLTSVQVTTLASIIACETNKEKEIPIIAGVYINRLKKNMPLQADPTLVWAIGDFSIRRVLNKHKKIDSPYNTYKYKGLTPGPIYFTDRRYIDGVLNYKQHKYLYFCAKEDLSGFSNFSETYKEHLKNARKYQKALNELGISK